MRQAEQGVGSAASGAVLERILRRIPDRITMVRLVRFGVSGVIATGVHVAIATPLALGLGVSPVLANGVAFVCATVFSYLLNALWSFSAKPDRHNFLRFVCVAVFGLLLTLEAACSRAESQAVWCVKTLGLVAAERRPLIFRSR